MKNEKWEKEVLRLLNDGETAEALKEFREYHGMVNRFVCDACGNERPSWSFINGCGECGCFDYEIRVVKVGAE